MAKKKISNNKISKDEQIGIHKGALSTLAKERIELIRMVQTVEQLMRIHAKALKELGVDIEAMIKKAPEKKGKIEDIV